MTKLRARAGAISFTGEYRWEPDTLRPHKFTIAMGDVDAAELERVLAPSLLRASADFWLRTLGLAPAPRRRNG